VLNILNEFIADFVKRHARPMRVLCFHLWLDFLCRFFYIISNRQCLRKH